MTETWAGLLRDVVAGLGGDSWECDERDSWLTEAANAKLTRLASLLEQITPEMVDGLGEIIHSRQATRPRVDAALAVLTPVLRALATPPSEETE